MLGDFNTTKIVHKFLELDLARRVRHCTEIELVEAGAPLLGCFCIHARSGFCPDGLHFIWAIYRRRRRKKNIPLLKRMFLFFDFAHSSG